MLRHAILLTVFCAAASSAFAQLPISLGLKGGVGLTDAFQSTTNAQTQISAGTSLVPASTSTRFYSDARDYIIGPFVELRLPFGLGAEADALYRPLSFATQTGTVTTSTRYSTWEFPILAKYRFGPPLIKAFVDAGPSFRATTSNTRYLSNKGFALGGGLDIKALFIHISPEIRYTRWGDDAKGNPAPSNVNQVEFLVGLAF